MQIRLSLAAATLIALIFSTSLSAQGPDRDCPEFASQEEAQRYFEARGGSPTNNADNSDADGDGTACENFAYGNGSIMLWLIGSVGVVLGLGLLVLYRRHRKRSSIVTLPKTKNEQTVLDIINAGENVTTEFKSTLRWSLRLQQKDSEVENEVVKTIAAFLNSKGGNLIIGVGDNRKS